MCVGEKLHVVIFVLTMVIRLQGWRKGGKRKREDKLEEEEDAFDEGSWQASWKRSRARCIYSVYH